MDAVYTARTPRTALLILIPELVDAHRLNFEDTYRPFPLSTFHPLD